MVYDGLERVKLRNDFYRDSYRKIIVALVCSLVVIICLVGVIFLLIESKPSPKYFAATNSGRIIPLIPLNQPNLKDKAVLQWASEAVTSIYSYNFVNFRRVFQNNKQYFTSGGWQSFLKALTESQNLKAVQRKKLIVSAVLTGAPVVRSQGEFQDRYTWAIQMPVLVTYQSASEQTSQNFIVTLNIKRVSTLDSVYGIGISEFVAEQRA